LRAGLLPRVLLLAHSDPSSVINTFMDHDSDRRKKVQD
jgi:hypothetical protein